MPMWWQITAAVALLALPPGAVIAFPVSTSLNGMSGEPALINIFKYSVRTLTWCPWSFRLPPTITFGRSV